MEAKTVKESRTLQSSIVLPPDMNHLGTIFGGKVMAYIDEVGAIAAMKHCRKPVVTASIDSVDFLSSVKVGYSINLEAFVASTGRSSMEVLVKVIAEDLLTGERELTATSFVTFVALDENGKPSDVPNVIPETEEEQFLHEVALERQKMREERKESSNELVERLEKNI